MKFASIGPLIEDLKFKQFPKEWIHGNLAISPEIPIYHTSGHMVGMNISPEKMLQKPREQIQQDIIDAAAYLGQTFNIDIIQLGGFTTSVTNGGKSFLHQNIYKGYVTHGDSYTAAVTYEAVEKVMDIKELDPSDLTCAIIGAYGIIGEALTKLLIPRFQKTILIGRRTEKLDQLTSQLNADDNFQTTTELKTNTADIVVTATNHPTALLTSNHLKQNACVIDVSQPPNLALDVCRKRPDIFRVDGGYVNFPFKTHIPFMEQGKIFACIAEGIMQALETHKNHRVGSIDLEYLRTTRKWAEKYQFTLKNLTNFGKELEIS